MIRTEEKMEMPKDAQIIAHLRKDGRAGLTHLSRMTGLAVSTIFDHLKASTTITRHCALLDFSSIGFGCRAMILLRTTKEKKRELGQHLARHPYVNNLHRINNGLDYCIEGIFRDMGHIERFIETIEDRFPIKSKEVHYLLEEMKREGFLTDPSSAEATLAGRL